MTNEDAFRKWRTDYESDYDKKPSYLEVWQAATSYMQEVEASSTSEPVAYMYETPSITEGWSTRTFSVSLEKNLPPDTTVTPLFTTPQRQQPLKRITLRDDIENLWYEAEGDKDNFANAIMDEMERINK